MTQLKSCMTGAGLLRRKQLEGCNVTMEAVFTPQQDAAEQRQVLQLQSQADEDWWLPGHPGWAIWPADSDQFLHQVRTACSPD